MEDELDNTIKKEKLFFNKLISQLTLREKDINSEYEKECSIDNQKFTIKKISETNAIYVKQKEGFLEYFLGKTDFIEINNKNSSFTPVGLNQLKSFLQKKKLSYA